MPLTPATRGGALRRDSGRWIRQIGSCENGLRLRSLTVAALFYALAALFYAVTALLQQLRDYSCPPRLVACANARTVVAVEVLIEEHQIVPVRVVVIQTIRTMNRPPAIRPLQEDSCHST